jgi:mRNA-degrading endonuclease RelE of RelBE toxin-antitoxin system
MTKWQVNITRRVVKSLRKVPQIVKKNLVALIREIESNGPVRGNWPNYGRLPLNRHHCHLKKGKPTYVAVWEKRANEVRIVDIIYVGSHENAPY